MTKLMKSLLLAPVLLPVAVAVAQPAAQMSCSSPEITSPGAMSRLNATIGHPHGVPSRVVAISDPQAVSNNFDFAALGNRFTDACSAEGRWCNASKLICHVTLAFANSTSESGLMYFHDPGKDLPLRVEWISDTAIAADIATAQTAQKAVQVAHKPAELTAEREGVFNASTSSMYNALAWCRKTDGVAAMKADIPHILGLGPDAATIAHVESVTVNALDAGDGETLWGCYAYVYWSNGVTELGTFAIGTDLYGQRTAYWRRDTLFPAGTRPWSGQ